MKYVIAIMLCLSKPLLAQETYALPPVGEYYSIEAGLKEPNKVLKLDLSSDSLRELPREILAFKNLERLNVYNNQLTRLPKFLRKLKKLRSIDLSSNPIEEFPHGFFRLRSLYLEYKKVEDYSTLKRLKKLEHLDLYNSSLTEIPPAVYTLKNLKVLVLRANSIQHIPEQIKQLWKLEELNLCRIALDEESCRNIGALKRLKKLNLACNNLKNIPSELGNCKRLEHLEVYKNQLTSLPSELGNCKRLEYLDLSENALTHIPPELGNCNKLRYLNVRKNQLTSIPRELSKLDSLRELWLGWNQLTTIPQELEKLRWIKKVSFAYNQLKEFKIGEWMCWGDVDLSYNQLTTLPNFYTDIFGCYITDNELFQGVIDIRGNPFSEEEKAYFKKYFTPFHLRRTARLLMD